MDMIRRTGAITLATFLVGVTASFAQKTAPPVTLSDTEQRTITSSKIGSRKIGSRYDLFISLPENYKTSNQSYPMLYVLDGWHFPLMAFIQENNVYSKRMGPVILVNIGHSPAKDAMTLRDRDFSPTRTAENPNSGGAPAFLDFLEPNSFPLLTAPIARIPPTADCWVTRWVGCSPSTRSSSGPPCFSELSSQAPR
jgi:enterochelin esterase-like enzyme